MVIQEELIQAGDAILKQFFELERDFGDVQVTIVSPRTCLEMIKVQGHDQEIIINISAGVTLLDEIFVAMPWYSSVETLERTKAKIAKVIWKYRGEKLYGS